MTQRGRSVCNFDKTDAKRKSSFCARSAVFACLLFAFSFLNLPAFADVLGVCDTSVQYRCKTGTSQPQSDSNGQHRWICNGVGNDADAYCAVPTNSVACSPRYNCYTTKYASGPDSGKAGPSYCVASIQDATSATAADATCLGTSQYSIKATLTGSVATPIYQTVCGATCSSNDTPLCGLANGQLFNSAPSGSSLCANGTASAVTSPSYIGPWSWNCTVNTQSVNCNSLTCIVPVNGRCNETVQNGCYEGDPNDGAFNDTTYFYKWRCDGKNTGTNSGECSFGKVVDGTCDNSTVQGCATGSAVDYTSTSTEDTWKCSGTHGGNPSIQCSKTKPVSYTWDPGAWVLGTCNTTNGACDNNTAYGCASGGTAFDKTEDFNGYAWKCHSPDGGPDSGACQKPKTHTYAWFTDNWGGCDCSTSTHQRGVYCRIDGATSADQAGCYANAGTKPDYQEACTPSGCTPAAVPVCRNFDFDGVTQNQSVKYSDGHIVNYGSNSLSPADQALPLCTGTPGGCNNSTLNGCTNGGGAFDIGVGSDAATDKWKCHSPDAGADSGQCSKAKPGDIIQAIATTAGSCTGTRVYGPIGIRENNLTTGWQGADIGVERFSPVTGNAAALSAKCWTYTTTGTNCIAGDGCVYQYTGYSGYTSTSTRHYLCSQTYNGCAYLGSYVGP